MADLCGPTNALQSFKNHLDNSDRSHQQDRLVNHQSTSQSFRSATQTAGALDSEFEAFQAGHHPLSTPTPPAPAAFFQQQISQLPQQNHGHVIHAPAPVAAATPDWAMDFQRMNLANPDIATQQRDSPSTQISTPQAMQNMMPNTSYSPMSFGFMNGGYGQNMGMGYMQQPQMPMMQQQHQQPQQQEDNFDMAAFEQAFDAASAEMEKTEVTSKGKEREQQPNEMMSGAVDTSLQEPIHERILFEQVGPPETQQQNLDQSKNPDALATTAGQLLQSISHDTSDKFQQSNFLALMRKLRDHEVHVEGENFIDVS
jgi:hypothetical protein